MVSRKNRKVRKYRELTKDEVKARTSKSQGMFDPILKEIVTTFTPAEGHNRIRILPPTWDDFNHWGYQQFVHYDVGPDSQSYLCPLKMGIGPCPICDERKSVGKSDEAYSRTLSPNQRIALWVIDRNEEEAGPKLWSMARTIDVDLGYRSVDKQTGDLLPLYNIDKGYDIEFTREGTGVKTRYTGIEITRHSLPLHDDPDTVDEWLDYVEENPIPSVFVFYDYEHIEGVFSGKPKVAPPKASKNEDKDDDGPPFDVDEDEETEEEAPARRKELPGRRKPPSPNNGQIEEDDDEDEFDDDEDDDLAQRAAVVKARLARRRAS